MPFFFQSASRRSSVDQMQSIHYPDQRTHRLVPHRSSARDLTDCQIRSRDPPPETMVQLSLVIQEVWDDIPKARITHLSPFMPRRCQVLHAAHSLSQPLLTLLHLTAHCTEQNATINFCLANGDSRQIADLTYTKQFLWAVFKIIKFPVEIDGRSLFCSVYTHIARFMGPTWGPPGSHRPQVGHVLAPWTLLSAYMRPPTWSFSVQTMTSTLFGAKILNSVVWLVACASCFLLIQRVDHITAQTAMIMMTSSNGNIFRVTGPLCGEFTGQRPVMRSFDVFFDLRLNIRLSKQSLDLWFETPSHSLSRQCNVLTTTKHKK